MTHAEEVMVKALRRIEELTKDSNNLRMRAIYKLADDALTDAWDDERPGVED